MKTRCSPVSAAASRSIFGVDPTLIRLAWVVFSLLGGSGLLAYILAAIIIPRDDSNLYQ